MSADEIGTLESVEKRSGDIEQSMVESVKQSTLPVLPRPVLLTPSRPAVAADSTMHVTMKSSDAVAADVAAHSDGNQIKVIFTVTTVSLFRCMSHCRVCGML